MSNPFTVETRRRLSETDPKWRLKAILRVVTTIFAAGAAILFAISVTLANNNFTNIDGNGQWTDGLAIAPSAFSLLLNLFLLALFLRRPLPFALPLLLDALTWALCVPSLIFAVLGGLFWYWTPATLSQDGSIDCTLFVNAFAEQCMPVAYSIGRMEIAGVVMLFVVFLLHVALFSIGCVDAYNRRKVARLGDAVEKGSFELQYSKDTEQGSM